MKAQLIMLAVLAVVGVTIVSAKHTHSKHLDDDDLEFDTHLGAHHFDEDEFEGGFGHPSSFHQQNFHHPHRHFHRHRPFKSVHQGHRRHLPKFGKRGHRGGVGAGIGAAHATGAAGGFRHEGSHLGAAGSHTHLGDESSLEGHRGSIVGGNKHFDAGVHSHDHNENAGINKHQAIDADQTIIKNRINGVSNTEGFRHSNDHSDGAHISGGASGFAAEGAGGKAHRRKEFDHDAGVIGAGEHSTEAGGAIGSIGAIGAGAGAGSL